MKLHALSRVPQREGLVGLNLRPERLAERGPVAVAHAWVAERGDDLHAGRKGRQLLFQVLGDRETAGHALERLYGLRHRTLHLLKDTRHVVGVQREKGAVQPVLLGSPPGICGLPEVRVRLKLLHDAAQPLVVRRLLPKEHLPLVEERRPFLKVGERGLHVSHDARHVPHAREVGVLIETSHPAAHLLELLLKLLLLAAQLGFVRPPVVLGPLCNRLLQLH
mmetsp:Transcript_13858/g.40838  ORF Transcript_13858/g.40838 Transcript_13858/m.40838 type:complete len:221 (-) Transcript_13858:736-1398(-)